MHQNGKRSQFYQIMNGTQFWKLRTSTCELQLRNFQGQNHTPYFLSFNVDYFGHNVIEKEGSTTKIADNPKQLMQLIRIEHSIAAGSDHLLYQPPPGSLSCPHSLIIHNSCSHTPEPDRYDHTKPKLKSFTFNKETQYKLLSPVVSHPN